MCSLSHGWVLDLYTNETETKRYDPSCVIDWLKILTISFSISNDATSCFCRYTKTNQIEDEISNAHVDSVSVKHKLTIVGPGGWPLDQGVADVGNAYPDTTNEVEKQIDSIFCLFYLLI